MAVFHAGGSQVSLIYPAKTKEVHEVLELLPMRQAGRADQKGLSFRNPRYTFGAKRNFPTLPSETYLCERPPSSWAITNNPEDRHRKPTSLTRKAHMLNRQDIIEVRHPWFREWGGSWARPWPWQMVRKVRETPLECRILHSCPLASVPLDSQGLKAMSTDWRDSCIRVFC